MSGQGQAAEDPSKIHTILLFLCEDEYKGVGPILATLLNGTRSTPEALKAISESLRAMIKTCKNETTKNAFRLDKAPIPPSLIDKPRQKLEFVILTSLIPLLAAPALSSIHRDLVINALQVVRHALSMSEDESAFIAAPGTLQRTKAFNRAILGILKEIYQFLRPKDLVFPCDCLIKMSSFKGLPAQENDPIWMSLRFSSLDDPITVLCFLVSFICPDSNVVGWPGYKVDEDMRMGLQTLTCSLLEIFLPNGTIARKDQSGTRSSAASPASIIQLYQACCHCILKTVPLLSADSRQFPPLAKSLMEILYHHVMTVEDRCKEWSANRSMSSRIKIENGIGGPKDLGGLFSVKDCRSELPAMTVLEDLLAKSLLVVMQSAFDSFPDTVHLREIRLLAVNLLFSKELLLLSEDESGKNVQRTLLLLVHRMVPSGVFRSPLKAITDILSRFAHLELDLLVHIVQSILEYWRDTNEPDGGTEDSSKFYSTLHRELTLASFSINNKRSIEETDQDQSLAGGSDLKGKRVRRDSLGFSSISPSLDSLNCSSIVSYSQPSQRPMKPSHPSNGVSNCKSPSKQLLSMLKKLAGNSTHSFAASQVSRGIPPPLSIEALRSSVILVQVWVKFTLNSDSTEVEGDVSQLTGLIESIGINYIIWALSPGMQNTNLNQSYLESSYPLMLDLIAPLSLYHLSKDLKVLLICLSSGPWFPDLSKPELWRDTENSMDIDEIAGDHQIVRGIRGITEGTENLVRLKYNTDILQSCKSFRSQKCKALKIMSTLPHCPELEVWRKDVILRSLTEDGEDNVSDTIQGVSQSLKIAALEALAVININSPDSKCTVESATSCLNLDDETEETKRTLAFCMGVVACGYSNSKSSNGPKYYYDALSQTFTSRWICHICDRPIASISRSQDHVAEAPTTLLESKFLNSFKRLIPTCVTEDSTLGLLRGLYRVFCHLDLMDEDLKAMDFGKLMLNHLCDPNDAIRRAAGDIAELLSRRAGIALVDDPLAQSILDESLARIGEAIARGFSSVPINTAIAWPLQLCQRIMRHLPEDHPMYHSLLMRIIDQAFADTEVVRSGFVFDQLSMIADDRGLTNYRLIRPQITYICARVIQKLEAEQDRWLEVLFYPWTRLSQTRFLQLNLSELVPQMILVNNPALIEKVAVVLNEKAGGLCIRQIDHILAAIYIQKDKQQFTPCIELLRSLIVQIDQDSGKEMRSLDIVELTTLSTEGLLCCLSVELGHDDARMREKAQTTVEIVEAFAWERAKQEQSAQGKVAERPTLAVFLRRHVLAIMSEVNNAIMDRTQVVTLRLKAKYLRSLILLVNLLKPIQSSVLSQILSPVYIALDIRGLRIHALRSLKAIVQLVMAEQLDVMLAHIVQTLIKYYTNSNEKERSIELEILKYLIVDQQEPLNECLPNVGTLPDLPDFAEMNEILKKAKTKQVFEKQLRRLIERSGNENAELAEQALLELREFLMVNERAVSELAITKEQQVDIVMRDLIRALLSGIGRFRGLDAPVPRLCVECIGIIGAIDPAKLSSMRLIPAPATHTNFADLEEAKNFVCEMIEVQLVGKTRSIGDIRSESHWAYTLQTLLSFCGITKGVLNAESQTISRSFPRVPTVKSAGDRWRAFPRHVQEVLELLIDAKYTKAESAAQRVYPSPLYPHVESFKEWLTIWTLALISKVNGRYTKEIFQACKHVVPYDTSTCLYMLPHLVLVVLLEGSEKDRMEIVNEMAAVLGKNRNWEQNGAEQNIGISQQASGELNQLGSQTVFVLFDHISKWIQSRKLLSAKASSARSSYTSTATSIPELSQTTLKQYDIAIEAVQEQLTSISHDVIAMAAFRCKAYARSLLHYEQYIRDSRQQLGVNDSAIQSMYEKLQEIYANLEEPDGMEGISTLITSGTPTQNLLQCESAGQWSEAQFYYEQGLQDDPGQFENHAGLYKCLENLGHYKMLSSCVQGDIQAYPDWEQQLTDWRIGSAWKVQNWESLETALSRSVHASFETGLGQLLLDLRDNRIAEFENHLQQVRCMLIPTLAAASMESYSRAYDHIVQLHMLHELEVAFRAWNPIAIATPSDSTGNNLGSQIAQSLREGVGDSYVERIRSFQKTLDQRFELMAPSFRLREQVATLRRIVLYDVRRTSLASHDDLGFLNDSCGRLWLQSARAARKSGNSEVSYSSMLRAEKLKNRSAPIERAKYELLHNNERQAIKTIDMALNQSLAASVIASRFGVVTTSSRLRNASNNSHRNVTINMDLKRVQDHVVDTNSTGYIRAKAYLLRTGRMDRSNLVIPADILEGYRLATMECAKWEKGYYKAGQYYMKQYETSRRYKTRPPHLQFLTNACRLLGKALTLGPKYLYQALPKLLTLWLELGNQVQAASSGNSTPHTGIAGEFQNLNKLMENLAEFLPEYMFLSAFPQIISRMCHKNADAFAVLQHIIVNVVLAFPDQAIWQMVSVSRSIVVERKRVCNKILESINLTPQIGHAIIDQIKEALDLCDNLITLCMAGVPDKVEKLSLQKHFPKVFMQLRQNYKVTVPCQWTLWPTIPETSATMASHQPFKSNLPKIERFMDEVEVMSSLQRPRKITVVGSDGVQYTFLCKPKDDLRKDAKVMEFNTLVNMHLRRNREANRKNLYIRTYAVVPLNEECGLIEWVHNTTPFRHIMQKQYKMNNMSPYSIAEIKRILDHDDHVRMFTKDLLPKFPTIFYQWFMDISQEPTAWFETRLRYTRTTAVMSMVGYIVGLGDRHGENLLFDFQNGDIVHVDFNCLFEQGRTFPKPERVPFRLTQNMVDAMGLSGYDGVYRLTCEQTLGIFRDNVDSLVSVLEGFLHDPLVEWAKNKRRGQQIQLDPPTTAIPDDANAAGGAPNATEEARARLRSRTEAKAKAEAAMAEADAQQNEKAQTIMSLIKRKLAGNDNPNGHGLSVQGQVEELIQAATSAENLSKMYIGWSAYL